MRAIRVEAFGGPDVLALQNVPDPVPAAGQVLINVQAAGVNPVETVIRSGRYARLPELPYTPGTDAAGTVAAVGVGVEAFKAGNRVYVAGTLTGAYAERTLADAACVHALPAGASFAQGAALGIPYATAYRALFQRAHARPGETLLVHGATGGVGLAAVQLAHAAGLRVFATGGSEAGRKLALDQGAAHAFGHRVDPAELRTLTAGRGVDVIVEMLANVNLGDDLNLLAQGGRVVVVGNHGTVEINPRDAMARDATILGMLLWNTPPADYASIHAALGAGLATGALHPVIAAEIPLADAAQAHARIGQPGALGKVVLVP
ncbi:MAG TPA: NADPH:quinone reductase [Rhodanobacteraceae bacterium]